MNKYPITTQTDTDLAAEANLNKALILVPSTSLVINNETTYALAHQQREDIRTYRDDVAAVYDPQEADLAEILARTKERRLVHERAAIARDTELKSSMSAYRSAEAAKGRALNEQLAAATRLAQQEVINRHAAQQASEGKTGLAMATLATPLPEIKLPKTAPSHTTTLHRWEMLDADKLHPEYLQPNDTKISAAVRKHQHNAPDIVGQGSIKYTPVVNPRRESRKKS